MCWWDSLTINALQVLPKISLVSEKTKQKEREEIEILVFSKPEEEVSWIWPRADKTVIEKVRISTFPFLMFCAFNKLLRKYKRSLQKQAAWNT